MNEIDNYEQSRHDDNGGDAALDRMLRARYGYELSEAFLARVDASLGDHQADPLLGSFVRFAPRFALAGVGAALLLLAIVTPAEIADAVATLAGTEGISDFL